MQMIPLFLCLYIYIYIYIYYNSLFSQIYSDSSSSVGIITKSKESDVSMYQNNKKTNCRGPFVRNTYMKNSELKLQLFIEIPSL